MSTQSIYERFRERFIQAAPPVESDREQFEADRELVIADRRTFVGTETFKDYRAALVTAIERAHPDPSGGMEAAAATAFVSSGLRQALGLLDTLASQAVEEA